MTNENSILIFIFYLIFELQALTLINYDKKDETNGQHEAVQKWSDVRLPKY